MTTRKKATGGKAEMKKLKLKKETIRDLDAQNKARGVKGGSGTICYTFDCQTHPTASGGVGCR